MKKIGILLLLLFIMCSCSSFKTPVNRTLQNTEIIPEKEEYNDNNPVIVSLYVDNAIGGLTKVEELRETWRKKRDITVLGSVFSEKKEIESDYFQNIWKNEASKYDDYNKYKTGWHIKFSLDDGTIIDEMIDEPDDVKYFYDYLEIYLYDSANAKIGVWYSHLTKDDMSENTILTSMKLTAGSQYEKIISPIEVSVFTYDTDDDFDSLGYHRGNSIATINIYNE